MTMGTVAALSKVLEKSEHIIDEKKVDCKQAIPHDEYQVRLPNTQHTHQYMLTPLSMHRQRKTEQKKSLLVECLQICLKKQSKIILCNLERYPLVITKKICNKLTPTIVG